MSTSVSDTGLALAERPSDGPPPSPDGARRQRTARPPRRVYARSAMLGAVPALAAFVALVSNNGGFFSANFFSGFYEVQARSLRRFHWDIPWGSLGIEAFRNGHRYYEYYGPWPALLRVPLMILLPGMDGRWTQLFMLVALALALAATTVIGWRIRTLVRGDDTPVARSEQWAVAIFTFTVGAGSVFLFLASQAWVYHEAEVWGASLALASFAAITEFLLRPRRAALVWASLLATLAILSRPSVGFGPIAALGLVAVLASTTTTRRLAAIPDALAPLRARARVALAAAVPALSYMYVNFSKFGSLLTFPSNRQVFSQVSVYRRAMLARNHNSLFGWKFAPTSLVQYLRPDALRFRSLLPFVDFPRTAPVVGHVLFDTIEPTSSVPSSMPLLTLLAVLGIVAIVRSARRGTNLVVLRVLLLATVAGAVTVIPYSYIGQRYFSDFMPLLVIAGLAGLHVLLRWMSDRSTRTKLAVTALALLAAFSAFVNAALGYSYHYETELNPEGALNLYVEQQYRVHSTFPGGRAPYVTVGDRLPYPPLARGTTFVVGNCDGVYWSQGDTWPPAEKWYALGRTRATGQYDLRVWFPVTHETTIEPLVVRGRPGHLQVMAVFIRKKTFSFAFWNQDGRLPKGSRKNHGFIVGPALNYFPDLRYPVEVVMDPNNGQITATMAGYVGFAFVSYQMTTPELQHAVLATDQVAIGTNTVGAPTTSRFTGRIVERKQPRPEICKYLTLSQQPRAGSQAAKTSR